MAQKRKHYYYYHSLILSCLDGVLRQTEEINAHTHLLLLYRVVEDLADAETYGWGHKVR